MKKDKIRIGCGAGFSGDRIEPAVLLAERGALDYLVLECLAERMCAGSTAAAVDRHRRNTEVHRDVRVSRSLVQIDGQPERRGD